MEALFATYGFGIVVHLAAQAGVRYSIDNPHSYVDSPRARSTAPTPRCPSPSTTTSTTRCRSTPPPRRPTS
jgi:hypothetical protein